MTRAHAGGLDLLSAESSLVNMMKKVHDGMARCECAEAASRVRGDEVGKSQLLQFLSCFLRVRQSINLSCFNFQEKMAVA